MRVRLWLWWVKWLGAALSFALAAILSVSLFWHATVFCDRFYASVYGAGVDLGFDATSTGFLWEYRRAPTPDIAYWWPAHQFIARPLIHILSIPLWMPLAASAAIAVTAFWASRRWPRTISHSEAGLEHEVRFPPSGPLHKQSLPLRALWRISRVGSLLLCGCLLLFWFRSYLVQDLRVFNLPGSNANVLRRLFLGLGDGRVLILRADQPFNPVSQLSWADPRRGDGLLGFYGCRVYSGSPALPVPAGWAITVPMWLLTTIAAAPAVWIPLWSRFRRWRYTCRDVCLDCGYNLTGNTSGTCPECGQPLPAKPSPPPGTTG